MSDITKKELASSLKWTWVIVIAAIAYSLIAPNYFFMHQGIHYYKGNKVTGEIEELSESGWVNISGG